jgi:hypothetical protein
MTVETFDSLAPQDSADVSVGEIDALTAPHTGAATAILKLKAGPSLFNALTEAFDACSEDEEASLDLLTQLLSSNRGELSAQALNVWSSHRASPLDALTDFALTGAPGCGVAARLVVKRGKQSDRSGVPHPDELVPPGYLQALVRLAGAPAHGAAKTAIDALREQSNFNEQERINAYLAVALQTTHADIKGLAQDELNANAQLSWDSAIAQLDEAAWVDGLLYASVSILAGLAGKVQDPSGLDELWAAYLYRTHVQGGQELAAQLGGVLHSLPDRLAILTALSNLLMDKGYSLDAQDPHQLAWVAAVKDEEAAARLLLKPLEDGALNARGVEVAAFLIKSLTGSADAAGALVNRIALDSPLDESGLRNLRVLIGGLVAMGPILEQQNVLVRKDFLKAVSQGTRQIDTAWRSTVQSAQGAFTAKLWMSILVFGVGLCITVVSAWQVIFNGAAGQLWGPAVSMAAGLGAMLTVVYSRPLREIARSVIELGTACAAMSAFVARVAEVNYAFASQYSRGQLDSLGVKSYGDLLDEAARDALAVLKKAGPGPNAE